MHRHPGQTRGKPDRQTRRQTDGRTVRQIGKQADGQTNRQTDRHTDKRTDTRIDGRKEEVEQNPLYAPHCESSMVNTFILRVNLHVNILKYVDSPFRTDIVRNALKTRTVLIPEKFATFGENVTYLEKKIKIVKRTSRHFSAISEKLKIQTALLECKHSAVANFDNSLPQYNHCKIQTVPRVSQIRVRMENKPTRNDLKKHLRCVDEGKYVSGIKEIT